MADMDDTQKGPGVIYSLGFPGRSFKRYVGSAKNMKNRARSHASQLRLDKHHCRALQNAAKKYGIHNIRVEILEFGLPVDRLIEREQVWLDKLAGTLYNKSPTAASRLGATMSAEARAKISASLIGNQYRKGIPFTESEKKRIGEGVRRANAEGRRRNPPPMPENLAAHNAAIKAGTKLHASKKPEQDAAIVADFNAGMMLKEIGLKYGLTPSAAGYAIRRVLKTPKGKWSRRCPNI